VKQGVKLRPPNYFLFVFLKVLQKVRRLVSPADPTKANKNQKTRNKHRAKFEQGNVNGFIGYANEKRRRIEP
jgi:hypothetical protein